MDTTTGAEIAATLTPPPTPWIMRGRMWATVVRAHGDVPPLPAGLTPVWPTRRVVTLVRYLEGTLRYDEMVIGRLARRGFSVAIFVDHIWVDSRESVAGGRRIWGLPKELAEFTWTGDRVGVEDRDGDIATLSVNQQPARSPELPLRAPGFGVRDGKLLYTTGALRARLRGSSLRIEAWSPRFGTLGAGSRPGIDLVPFQLTIGDARILGE